MSAITVYTGRVFASSHEEAMEKITALHPAATRVATDVVRVLRQGIWWEYHAVYEEAAG